MTAGSGFVPPNMGKVTLGPITESTACSYCPDHPWKTLRGMKNHVRAKHPHEYRAWLLAAGLRGMTRQEKQARRLEELRNDPDQTAARYDEIIKLRMLLLDAQDVLADEFSLEDSPLLQHMVTRTTPKARLTWKCPTGAIEMDQTDAPTPAETK